MTYIDTSTVIDHSIIDHDIIDIPLKARFYLLMIQSVITDEEQGESYEVLLYLHNLITKDVLQCME